MLERQKRLLEVYEYARKRLNIHTQTDFAKATGSARAVISSAMNGNPQYLTDGLFKRIAETWPGIFSLSYLLTGEGYLITAEEENKIAELEEMDAALKEYRARHKEGTETKAAPEPIDQSSLVNALLAAKDETIASLKRQIEQQSEMIELLRKQYDDIRYSADRPTRRYDTPEEKLPVANEG